MDMHSSKNYPEVSVIIPTMNSERYLGTLLDFLKPHFKEIIVGVDSKSNQETYDCAVASGCKVVWMDNPASYVESVLVSLLEHCSYDWVLRLDDDELISLKLISFIRDIYYPPLMSMPSRSILSGAGLLAAAGLSIRPGMVFAGIGGSLEKTG